MTSSSIDISNSMMIHHYVVCEKTNNNNNSETTTVASLSSCLWKFRGGDNSDSDSDNEEEVEEESNNSVAWTEVGNLSLKLVGILMLEVVCVVNRAIHAGSSTLQTTSQED